MTVVVTPPEESYSIGAVAERLGLSAHTLRYYERIGLLEVARDPAGRRLFCEGDIARLGLITHLRAADLPIGRIQRYFALAAEGPHTEPERLAILEQHRDEVRARLASLEAALATIEFKIARYGGTITITDTCNENPTSEEN